MVAGWHAVSGAPAVGMQAGRGGIPAPRAGTPESSLRGEVAVGDASYSTVLSAAASCSYCAGVLYACAEIRSTFRGAAGQW